MTLESSPAETETQENESSLLRNERKNLLGRTVQHRSQEHASDPPLAMANGRRTGRADLESLPSLWKASGLEPSFMNFMVKNERNALPSSVSPSLLCLLLRSDKLPCSFSSASSLPPFHASGSWPGSCLICPPVLSLLCSGNSGDHQPSSQQVVESQETHTAAAASERSGEWTNGGVWGVGGGG
jgi:hypothetical protein